MRPNRLTTVSASDFPQIKSALQESIHEGDPRMAALFVAELLDSGYQQFAWKRLIVISAEDCWGQTLAILALSDEFERVNRGCNTGDTPEGRLLLAKAADLLAQAREGINCATVSGA